MSVTAVQRIRFQAVVCCSETGSLLCWTRSYSDPVLADKALEALCARKGYAREGGDGAVAFVRKIRRP